MITVPCPMCGETLEGAVRFTQVSPLKGASIIECPGCDYRLEFRYDVTKKAAQSDGFPGGVHDFKGQPTCPDCGFEGIKSLRVGAQAPDGDESVGVDLYSPPRPAGQFDGDRGGDVSADTERVGPGIMGGGLVAPGRAPFREDEIILVREVLRAVLAWEAADNGTVAERQAARETLHLAIEAWRVNRPEPDSAREASVEADRTATLPTREAARTSKGPDPAEPHRERTTGIGIGHCVLCALPWPCDATQLRRALAWLIRYRDTTRIPPVDIAETLYEPATQRAILRAGEPIPQTDRVPLRGATGWIIAQGEAVTDIPIVEGGDDAG